jgi:ribonuclease III family protein
MNNLVLAFIGDSVFELKIREYFVEQGLSNVKDLQKQTSQYASAKGHYQIMEYLLNHDKLSAEELKVYKKGRNAKVNQRRKNFNSTYYHASTGFEALIGYLYYERQTARIDELIKIIVNEVDM